MPTTTCPSCDRRLKVPATAAGRSVRCPSCSTRFTIPDVQEDERRDAADDSDDEQPARTRSRRAARTPPPSSTRTPLIVAGVVGAAVLLLLLVGGGAVFMFLNSSKPVQAKATETPATPTTAPSLPTPPLPPTTGGLPAPAIPTVIRPAPKVVPPPTTGMATPPQLPPVKPDDRKWVAEAEKELEAARKRPKVVELVKPARMTPDEYDLLKESAVDLFKSVYPVDKPEKLPEGDEAVLLLGNKFDAVALMPESHRVVRREAFTRLAEYVKNDKDALTNLANAFPETLPLYNQPKFLAAMRARLPWAERKKLWGQFSKSTGQTEALSLLHPFDELTGEEMKAAAAAASKAKGEGLGNLSGTERALILRAGVTDFFAAQLRK